MVLLLIISIGMLSLSSVTLRAQSQSSAQDQAKANARLALTMAIGELQRQMGPDQRISITADQRPKVGTDGAETSAAPGNQHWTGVFDAWPANLDSRPTPSLRSWLVSGEPSANPTIGAPETALAGSEMVELVGKGTLGSASTAGRVNAPLVEVSTKGDLSGRMAWWVGDQGVKAALGTSLPSQETRLGVVRNNLHSAPRNAVELASTGVSQPFAGMLVDDPRLPLTTSWGQTDFLATGPDSQASLFHDLVGSSSGLMTNVRDGGFRKDLSLKMETYTGPPNTTDPENVLYNVGGKVGINFQEIWAYYHLYKQLQYGGGGAFTTGGSIPSTAPYLRTANSLQGITQDSWDAFKHPITISYQMVLSFEMAPNPEDPNQNILWLNIDPIVTLWNPLDVAVDIPPSDGARCYMYVFWVIPYDINVRVNGGPEVRCSLLESISNKGDANILRLNAGRFEHLTLRPGEVVKISQTGNTNVYNAPANGLGSWNGLDGKKGFNYGGGIRVPLRDQALNPVVLAASDSLDYSATPNARAAGGSGNSKRWSLTHTSLVLGSPWGTNIHLGLAGIDHWAGYSRAKAGQTRTRHTSIPNPFDIRANEPQYSEVFPTIAGAQYTRTLTGAQIAASKAPFMVHSYNIKTEVENTRGTKMLARFNPTARHLNFYDLSEAERDMLPYETGATPLTSWLNAPLDQSFNGRGFFGSSLASELGSNFVTTHSVPRQPIVSLAALQNSFANGFNRLHETMSTEHASARLPMLPQISHAIGNSLAPSMLASDKTEGQLSGAPHPIADHSYLANRELWDNYFFSGIAPQLTPAFAQNRDQKKVAQDFFSGNKALPVARYLPVLDERTPTELANSFFTGAVPSEPAINAVASYLRVDGMFNVNSTSVEAWKTVLGSLKDRPIVVRDENGVESIAEKDGNTPVAAMHAPVDVITADQSGMDRDQWNGRRTLTDDEIEAFAQAIVREVRKRGPFLSLADFVNRRVGTDKDLAKAGAIQAALDSDDVPINVNQNTDRAVADSVTNRFAFPEAEEGAMTYGAPSVVKQADVLTPIAPILSARSDNFIVRAYGEAVDANGAVIARAWCEAVVERDRNYLDSQDKPETLAANLTSSANQTFGRRFKIISFRWLNPSEI